MSSVANSGEALAPEQQACLQRKQLAWRARTALVDADALEPVASPCINVCRMTEDRSHCQGCFRTIDEIRAWSKADAAERLQIWSKLLQRAGLDDPRPAC